MSNLAGVTAVLSVLLRPSLVIPHIQTPDIRHLDWSALHASGVRFLVFDKDNCLTIPHSDHLEPALIESWAECQRVFGRENILIVSNSSGSTDDPSGLGAESLSRALGVPVLCHSQKKPGPTCVNEALEYFVRLSFDPEGTVREGQRMPPGLLSSVAAGEQSTWIERRKMRKMLRDGVPQDAEGRGSILLVGDRTMTDVVLAHRMNDELVRRREKSGVDTKTERIDYDAQVHGLAPAAVQGSAAEPITTLQAAMSMSPGVTVAEKDRAVPPPQCISVLTTGLWANEGGFNMLMRSLEARVTMFLVGKGFQPGQRGFWFPAKNASGQVDWQSIAVLDQSKLATVAQGGSVEAKAADLAVQAARTGDAAVDAGSGEDPSLGAILVTVMLQPLPPRLAGVLRAVFESRPVGWIAFHMKEGWNIIIKGLEFGVRQAGLLEPTSRSQARRNRRDAIQNDPLAPPLKRELRGLRTGLSSRKPPPASSQILEQIQWPSSLLDRRRQEPFSAHAFLQRLNRRRPSSLSASNAAPTPTHGASNLTRSLTTSASRLDSRHPAPRPGASAGVGAGAGAARGKVPMRNWIAAFSALVLIPSCYYGGVYLHDLQDLRRAERELAQKTQIPLDPEEVKRRQEEAIVRQRKIDEEMRRASESDRVERKKA
ncbi:hypothetical protein ACQY0O_004247 [Thecaphora frezii]